MDSGPGSNQLKHLLFSPGLGHIDQHAIINSTASAIRKQFFNHLFRFIQIDTITKYFYKPFFSANNINTKYLSLI